MSQLQQREAIASRSVDRSAIDGADLILAAFASYAVVAAMLLLSENCRHWFVAPVFLCGVLIGVDAVQWCRGKVDVFDPKGILGVFGFHFFFLAPMLHGYLDWWMYEVEQPPDWRPWLGYMAILNVFGLLIYRLVLARMSRADRRWESPRVTWTPRPQLIMALLILAIVIGTAIQLMVYASYGGIRGFISAFERQEHNFLGASWALMIAGRIPLLLTIVAALYAQKRKYVPSWFTLSVLLVVFVTLQAFYGGLRGARSDIIYALVWAGGIIHFWVRPVSKKMIFVGVAFVTVLMYVYGFYKSGGVEGLESLASKEGRSAVEGDSHRSLETIFLADFGRADVQAYVLYQMYRDDSDVSLSLGRTYLAATFLPIPGPLWRNKPPSKVREAWDILLGVGAYEREFGKTAFSDRPVNTRIFGLAGEMLVNFGPFAVPFVFVVLGLAVGWTRRCMIEWPAGDTRLLLLPFLCTLCILLLSTDSDNVIYYSETSGAVPVAILFFGSDRRRSYAVSRIRRSSAMEVSHAL